MALRGDDSLMGAIRQSGGQRVFTKTRMGLALLVIVGVVALPFAGLLVETNNAGWYSVKQAAISGNMVAYTKSGMFWQMFGDVYRYKQSDALYFSKHDGEGGEKGDDTIEVRFNDGATAKVTGNVRIRLPDDPVKLLEIHQQFRSYEGLIRDTAKQVVSESVILTASLMSAEESYTTKRAEFSQLAYDQVRNGVYLTEADERPAKDPITGEIQVRRIVNIQHGKDGKELRKEAVLAKYGIAVDQFIIKEIDYPESIQKTINAKQEALMQTVSAKAQAEKAVQDRLTAEEVGKKNVMTAKYEQETENAKTIAAAQRDLTVSELERQKAEKYKMTQILKGEGEAAYRRKLMEADNALEIRLKAMVQMNGQNADALSKMQQPLVPSVMMGGGAGGTPTAADWLAIQAVQAAKGLGLNRDLTPAK